MSEWNMVDKLEAEVAHSQEVFNILLDLVLAGVEPKLPMDPMGFLEFRKKTSHGEGVAGRTAKRERNLSI